MNEPTIQFRDQKGRPVVLVQTIFRIVDKHDDGTPKTVVQIAPDETVDLAKPENKEFITGWIDINMRPSKGN